MGLVPGVAVRVVTVAPLGDPLQIEVRGGQWSIRRDEAAQIAGRDATDADADACRHASADRARRQSERRQDHAVQRADRLVGEGLELSRHHRRAPQRRRCTLPAAPPTSTTCPARTASTRAAPRSRSRSTRSSGCTASARPTSVVVCVDATQLARSAYLLLQMPGARRALRRRADDGRRGRRRDARRRARSRALLGCEVVAGHRAHAARPRRAASPRSIARCARERTPTWHWKPSPALRAHLDAVRAALPAPWRARALRRDDWPPPTTRSRCGR